MLKCFIVLAVLILVSGCTQQGFPGSVPSEYVPDSVGNFTGKEIETISCGFDSPDTHGRAYHYTHQETGVEYVVNVVDKVNGEILCTGGAINYFEEPYFRQRCSTYMIEYKDSEMIADIGAHGPYFFWISDDSSVMVSEKGGRPSSMIVDSPAWKEMMNASLYRSLALIDYYMASYPSVKRCE